MTKKGSQLHEQALEIRLDELKNQGYTMLDLNAKSPDAIGAKIVDGEIQIIAMDVVSADTKKTESRQNYHCKQKKRLYESLGFDQVFVFEYYKPESERKKERDYKKQLNEFDSKSKF